RLLTRCVAGSVPCAAKLDDAVRDSISPRIRAEAARRLNRAFKPIIARLKLHQARDPAPWWREQDSSAAWRSRPCWTKARFRNGPTSRRSSPELPAAPPGASAAPHSEAWCRDRSNYPPAAQAGRPRRVSTSEGSPFGPPPLCTTGGGVPVPATPTLLTAVANRVGNKPPAGIVAATSTVVPTRSRK